MIPKYTILCYLQLPFYYSDRADMYHRVMLCNIMSKVYIIAQHKSTSLKNFVDFFDVFSVPLKNRYKYSYIHNITFRYTQVFVIFFRQFL